LTNLLDVKEEENNKLKETI